MKSILCILLLAVACAAPGPMRVSLNECSTEFQTFPRETLPLRLEFSSDALPASSTPGIRKADSGEIAFLRDTIARSLEGISATPTGAGDAVLTVHLQNFALSQDAGYVQIKMILASKSQAACTEVFASAVADSDKPSERITRSATGRILLAASRCRARMPPIESDRCGAAYIAKSASDLLPLLPTLDAAYECAFMRNGPYGPECVSYRKLRRGRLNWASTLR